MVVKNYKNQMFLWIGLEQLSALEELDVAYNCISVREAIQSLSCLPQLVNLCLQFNPISYSKTYRITVLQKVSSAVNKKKVSFLLHLLFCRWLKYSKKTLSHR